MKPLRYTLAFTLVAAFLFATGCSNLPWTSSSEATSEVAGTYEAREFKFIPKASVLDEIAVLNHLSSGQPTLELTQSNDFVLKYQPQPNNQVTLTGTYSVTSNKIELNGQREDTPSYHSILLNREFYLHREGSNVVWVDAEQTVNLEELSASYEGLKSVSGVLQLKFVRPKSSAISGR